MFRIKRLDTFILGKFLQLFVGAFFICLFVFMMQFTWRWINDLVGKGLTPEILAQFFWYMGITLVPMSLPLAILLASLITFGNMGEQLELLSMKAAGVSLVRIMTPILGMIFPLVGISFVFQNSIAPHAHEQLRALATSIKISQPALQIPEGVFYAGVDNLNLFVEKKNPETGMLYRTIIYKTDQGFDKAQIVLADSAHLEMTDDKLHLRLTLWSGEQFQNLKSNDMSLGNTEQPYDRETFDYKQLLIDFDANFNQLEADQLRSMPQAKTMAQIQHDVDSMNRAIDSVVLSMQLEQGTFIEREQRRLSRKDSLAVMSRFQKKPFNIEQVFAKKTKQELKEANLQLSNRVQMLRSEYGWRKEEIEGESRQIRRHEIEWHQKITLSLACLLFFFVGAPLGAIIRKGGLGFPTVISVAIFVLYYIINTSGMKTAREGTLNIALGMWMSTVILAPAGVYLTYMANRDSVVFNMDLYIALMKRLLGLRTERHLLRKEVVITLPNYDEMTTLCDKIRQTAISYAKENRLWLAPNYVKVFFCSMVDEQMERMSEELEMMVEELSNTTDAHLLQAINDLPIIDAEAHISPFRKNSYNVICGLFVPVAFLLWIRIWRCRIRLLKDLKQIDSCCTRIQQRIQYIAMNNASGQ